MKIHEYQTKSIFRQHEIPVLKGEIATTPEEVYTIATSIGGVVAVKAQVLVGGRGKAGGIKIAKTPEDAKEFAQRILGTPLKGLTVNKVLVEAGADIKKEFYLGFVIDTQQRRNVLIFTPEGGVDVEELAVTRPEAILKLAISPTEGLTDTDIKTVLDMSTLDEKGQAQLRQILTNLYKIYQSTDAELIEINPLVLTGSGDLIALDGKLNVDDNALFRQAELTAIQDQSDEDPIELEAKRRGLAYVRLDGNVGIIGNGAGLVMGTMDEVQRAGGKPADFLDLGGGAKADVVKNALEILLLDPNIKGLFINIFGGITRCDEVAKGIITVCAEKEIHFPIVIRLEGTQAEEGKRLLASSTLVPVSSMQEGAKRIVELIKTTGQ